MAIRARAQALYYVIHSDRVLGSHYVGQKSVRARDRLHLITSPSALGWQLAGVDNPLQLMNRLAAGEQRMDLATEVLDGDVVAQENASEQPNPARGPGVLEETGDL